MQNQDGRIPVSVITGFLGSGKTTLINHLIHHPAMGEAAIIVNEFGEINIDHTLIEKSDEHTILLGTGCLCCAVRGDLVETLHDLSLRRLKREVPPFKRLVIETTGLADPLPILHALMSVPVVARYRLDMVVTTVDAVNGFSTLDHHEEAVKQVAVADRIVITKTDLVKAKLSAPLSNRLEQLNPAVKPVESINGDVDPAELFDGLRFDLATKIDDVELWLNEESYAREPKGYGHVPAEIDINRHDEHIKTFCLTFKNSLKWNVLAAWLDTLATNEGEKLLRVKGLVNVEGIERPVVVHAVQHLFHPPTRIAEWPDDDRRSRIVFITRDLSQTKVQEIFRDMENALNDKI